MVFKYIQLLLVKCRFNYKLLKNCIGKCNSLHLNTNTCFNYPIPLHRHDFFNGSINAFLKQFHTHTPTNLHLLIISPITCPQIQLLNPVSISRDVLHMTLIPPLVYKCLEFQVVPRLLLLLLLHHRLELTFQHLLSTH